MIIRESSLGLASELALPLAPEGCPALAIGFAQRAMASSGLINVHQCPRSVAVVDPILRRAERMLRAKDAEVLAVSLKPMRIADPRSPRRTALIAQFLVAHLSRARTSCSERRVTFALKALDVLAILTSVQMYGKRAHAS